MRLLDRPVSRLCRQGGVAKGESFTETTVLVDTGLDAIVRHPQYIGLLTMGTALMLIVQHWSAVALGAASIGLSCVDSRKVEREEGADKFGNAYLEYMVRVPEWNPLAGVWRWLRRRLS